MARLPIPGSDSGSWGNLLNDFMLTSHKADGVLKDNIVDEQHLSTSLQAKVNTVMSGGIPDNSITSSKIVDGSITETDLNSAVVAKLNQAPLVSSVAGRTGVVALTKADVGLTNVDNTTDAAKPISSATQTALAAKANDTSVVHLAGAETVTGAKTFSTPVTVSMPTDASHATTKQYVDGLVASVGSGGGTVAWGGVTGTLSNQTDLTTALGQKANATHVHAATDVTTGTIATARLGSGTASATTYLRGDQTWATIPAAVDMTHVAISAHTAAYTLTLDDDGKAVEMSTAAAVNVTVPSSASVNFPIGTVIEILQAGTGQAILVPGGGVTLRTPSTLATKQRWSSIGLRKRAADEWVVSGDLA